MTNDDEFDGDGFKALAEDLRRAANGQHVYEMTLVEEFDRILLENDTALRDALAAAMQRRAQRRGLIAERVADAAFEIVGTNRPPKIIQDAQRQQQQRLAKYDRQVDPLNVYGENE